jgi:hypothetical protein
MQHGELHNCKLPCKLWLIMQWCRIDLKMLRFASYLMRFVSFRSRHMLAPQTHYSRPGSYWSGVHSHWNEDFDGAEIQSMSQCLCICGRVGLKCHSNSRQAVDGFHLFYVDFCESIFIPVSVWDIQRTRAYGSEISVKKYSFRLCISLQTRYWKGDALIGLD